MSFDPRDVDITADDEAVDAGAASDADSAGDAAAAIVSEGDDRRRAPTILDRVLDAGIESWLAFGIVVACVVFVFEQIHPEPFRSVSRQRFRAQVNALAERAAGLTPNERLVGMLRIVALLGPRNGHTGIFPLDPSHTRQLHLLPLRLYELSDGLFVVDERGGLGLVGTRLVAVEGVPVADEL